MSTVNQDELKAIQVLKFNRKESEWDNWSENICCFGQSKSFAGILLGTEKTPRADEEIDRKKEDDSYELT